MPIAIAKLISVCHKLFAIAPDRETMIHNYYNSEQRTMLVVNNVNNT
jgi:hypothetical protein